MARNQLASIEASEGFRIWPAVRGFSPWKRFKSNTPALAWGQSVQSAQDVCGRLWAQPQWLRVRAGSWSETWFSESYSSPSIHLDSAIFPSAIFPQADLQKCVLMDVLGIALQTRASWNCLTPGWQQRLESGLVAAFHLANREAILDTAHPLHCLLLPSSEASVIAAPALESRPTGCKKLIRENHSCVADRLSPEENCWLPFLRYAPPHVSYTHS